MHYLYKSFLYVYRLCNDLQILEALTTKKCQEEFSQESLETLGDSFLKYIATQHLFSKYKHQHEGMLTKMKKNLISNAALCQLACSNNLVVLFTSWLGVLSILSCIRSWLIIFVP
jgi:endoribonuclease Dicer